MRRARWSWPEPLGPRQPYRQSPWARFKREAGQGRLTGPSKFLRSSMSSHHLASSPVCDTPASRWGSFNLERSNTAKESANPGGFRSGCSSRERVGSHQQSQALLVAENVGSGVSGLSAATGQMPNR